MIDRSTSVRRALKSRQRGFIIDPFRFGVIDPDFASVNLLCHMDSDSPFVDSSSFGLTMTTSGSAFSQSSIAKFDGALDKVLTSDNILATSFPAGHFTYAGDFTIEGWFYFKNVSGSQQFLCDHKDSGQPTASIVIQSGTVGTTGFYGDLASGGYIATGGTTAYTAGVWYHIAVTRSGSSVTIWRDGVSYVTGSSSATWGGNRCVIGAYGSGGLGFDGYIDDFRVTNGVCRYTGTFTPPTAAYPDS